MAPTYWILRLKGETRYVGSPTDTTTRNPNLAACWSGREKVAAERLAKTLDAEVVPFAAEDEAWRAAGKPMV